MIFFLKLSRIEQNFFTFVDNIINMEDNTEYTQPVSGFQSRIDMGELSQSLERIKSEIAKVIVGQNPW